MIRCLSALLFLFFCLPVNTFADSNLDSDKELSWSVFPIVIYNSDVGFGFGGRGVIKNIYSREESFDLILFGSTRGEQWYAFTFSIPDFELRQGKLYPFSFDLKIEYNKKLKSNFSHHIDLCSWSAKCDGSFSVFLVFVQVVFLFWFFP